MTAPTSVCVVYGAPTAPGRLAVAAAAVVAAVTAAGATPTYVDLHALADDITHEPAATATQSAVRAIEDADAVIVTSPVYRASLPGALKCLIDLLPVNALKFKPVGLVVMGGSPHHYLAVDHHLRDILAWFGALANPTSVYATGKSFTDGQAGAELTAEIAALVGSVIALAGIAGQGPEPLAASAW